MESRQYDSAHAFRELGRRVTSARRPWALIAAALLFALLAGLLWVKWRDTRTRVDQLEAELRQVYSEAEALRTQEVRTRQRMVELERELRARSSPRAAPAGRKESSASFPRQ
jgi:hypothetical protein